VVSYRIDVAQAASVRVGVYDAGGRLVERLIDRRLSPGTYDFKWRAQIDRQRLAPGVYYMRLDAGGVRASEKLVLLGR
jgi:hypothetical protein